MDAVDDAIDEVHSLQQELQKQAAENTQLRERLHKQTEEVTRLQTNMKVMAQQKEEQKQREVSRLQSWVESQSTEISELRANLRDKDMALQGLAGLQLEKEDLSKRIEEMSALEVSTGQHTQALKAAFEKEVQRLEEERDRLERENTALKASNPQNSNIVKQPRQRGLSDALHENHELHDRIDSLEVENKDLRRQLRDACESRKPDPAARDSPMHAPAPAANGSAGTRAKHIARAVIDRIREHRLHQRLDDESERAHEIELRARNLEDQSTRLHRENARLREELQFTQGHAHQQRVMKYGAKQRAEDRDVKVVELQRHIDDLKAKLEETAHEEMMMLANMKGNDALMRSLYNDLKGPGIDFDGIESDSSPELESEPESFAVPTCDSGHISVSDGKRSVASVSDGKKSVALVPDGCESEAKSCSSHLVESVAYKHYFAMYQPKASVPAEAVVSGYTPPGGYRSKREKQIAKMAGKVVQQKLLKALHLIELLQRANNKLTEDMEDYEDAAAMAQRMERWLLIVVTFMSLLVVGLGLGLMSSCKS
mmetsp:Transcript_102505/g.256843  ORF Transcript_102505/g.256843 Transcript_102505/m.256843 type:complete len:542 (+) Transcript_102505:78-1703(+)